MIDLLTIKDAVQQVANAISTVCKIDVEVININYYRVAGTGKYSVDLGEKIKYSYVYQQVISNQLEILIPNPKENEFCLPCPEKIHCQEYAELCAPIMLNGTVIGVFGLLAFNEIQRKMLIDGKNELLPFIKEMGQMIATKASEQQFIQQLHFASEQLETIINSVTEGIIAVNESEMITHCNDSAADLLHISKKHLLGRSVSNLIPNSCLLEVLTTGVGYTNKEIIYTTLKKTLLATARPIIDDQQTNVGAVISFRALADIKQLIFDYTDKQIDIPLNAIIGESQQIKELRNTVMKIANSSSTVLIRGESGTGKELFARAIHSVSIRKDKPFIAINCSAIPETLLESELFGYDEGAFTGAKRRGKPGKFELADGGTVLLDEIGDMPLHLQAKILRTLQERTIERVGGSTSIHINVRFIAATNRLLENMISHAEFREDLYYRLNVIPLTIPPLRDRMEDILPLLKYFTDKYNKAFDKSIKGFSEQTIHTIMAYHWPGNIRELENAVEYAFNIETSSYILKESLPAKLTEGNDIQQLSGIKTLEEIERETIKTTMNHYDNTLDGKKQLASALGIGIATLYRKLNYYNLSYK